ncbi:YadA-like family protein [Pseudoxanthomonas indica]|nr:YadA-like family protein [Pseudoxanthomonas indica]
MSMQNNRITDLAPGVNGTDAANMNQLNNLSNDSLKWDSGKGAFSAAHGGVSPNKITDVADGTLAAGSKDAVNGNQLFTTNQNVTNLTTNITEGKIGLVQQAASGANITVGKDTNGTAVDFKGTAGERKLINVADGTVAASSKDAINGGQLYNVAGDTSDTYISNNGAGVKYARTNDTGLTADDAHASAAGATAVGYNAKATTADALALGRASQAAGISTVAAGGNAKASGLQGSAVGYNAQATSANTSALGFDAQATGSSSTALGASSRATATQSIAIGQAAQATKDRAAAIGRNAQATNTDSTAIGDSVKASGVSSSAFGSSALAQADYSVAIGNAAQATAVNSVALGTASTTTANLTAAAYKPNASSTLGGATAKGEVSVGSANNERRITNLAAGSADTDAVNVSQLKSLESKVGSGTGTDALAVHYDAAEKSKVTLAGTPSTDGGKTGGTTLSNVHQGAVTANSTDAINGAQMYALTGNPADQQPTIPDPNNPSGPQIPNPAYKGSGIRYFKANGKADDTDDAVATGTGAVAMGANAKATAANSVALGAGSTTTAVSTTAAFNPNASFTLVGATSKGEVSVGSANNERRITNLAAGASDTDAVNVSQLKALNSKVENITTPASSKYFKVVSVSNEAQATASESMALGGNTAARALNATAIGSNAVVDAANSTAIGFDAGVTSTSVTNAVALGAGSRADAADTVSVGRKNLFQRRITNVAAGVDGTDAVNKAQMDKAIADAKNAGSRRLLAVTPQAAAGAATDYLKVSSNVTAGLVTNAGSGTDTLAVGPGASAIGDNSVAVGTGATLGLGNSTAIGYGSGGTSVNITTVGYSATATANSDNATVIGFDATVDGAKNGVAIGSLAIAEIGESAVAIGTNATASKANSVALGSDSITSGNMATTAYVPTGTATGVVKGLTPYGQVSVGAAGKERRVTNVAAAAEDTDAVNLSQLKAVEAKVASGGGSGTDALAVHYDAAEKSKVTLAGTPSTDGGKTGGTTLSNVHQGAVTANSTDAINGAQMYALTGNPADQQPTIPDPNNPSGPQIPNPAYKGKGIRYFKANGKADDTDDAVATGTGAVAMGANAKATAANSVALGAGSTTTAINTTAAYNPNASFALAGATSKGEVSVGSANNERRITNLAAGSADTDAVNVSQLKSLESKVGSGTGTDALAVHYDAAEKSKVTLAGTASTDGGKTGGTTLSNVHQGAVTANSTDAINGAQMYALTGNPADQQPTIPDPSNPSGPQIPNPAYKGKGIRYFKADGKADDTDDAVATGSNAVAMGANAKATTANSVALGAGATTTETAANLATAGWLPTGSTYALQAPKAIGEVSVGSAGKERRVTNVAAGRVGTDAVNLSQLQAVDAKIASSGGGGGGGIDTGAVRYDGADKSIVTLQGAGSSDGGKTGGTTMTGLHQGNIAAGSTDAINGSQVYALTGNPAQQDPNNPGYKGKGIRYFKANGKADDTDDASATGTGAVAMGANAKATAANSVALGAGSTTTAINTTAAYNPYASFALAGATSKGEVSVGSANNERRITNLAAGSADTDAVNVSQLKSVDSKFKDAGITDPNGSILDVVTYDAGSSKGKVTLAGTKSTDGGKTGGTTLSNVHQGAVTANSTDAINGSQMYALTGNPADQRPTIPDPNNPSGPQIPNPAYKGSGIRYFKANGKADDTDDAVATGTGAVAMGANAKATAANSVALGADSTTTADLTKAAYVAKDANPSTVAGATAVGEVSLGSAGKERRITNLAAGASDTDAVNVSQLKSVDSKFKVAGITDPNGSILDVVTYDAGSSKGKVTLAGTKSTDGGKTGGTTLSNVHQGAVTANSTDAINGAQMYALTGNPADQQPTIPDPNNPSGPQIPNPAYKGKGIRYFKANGKADDTDDAVATGSNAVAMGANAKATAANSVALGADSTTTADLTKAAYVAKDANPSTVAGATAVGEVSVGSAGKERRITNLAAGASDTDAVNVSQLKAVDSKFKVSGLTDDKGNALEAVVYKPGSNKTEVNFAGATGTLLTNVAPGRIAKDSKEAVNGAQIADLRDSLQGQITNIDNRVTNIENNGGGRAPFIAANGSPNPANADAGTSPGVAVGYNTNASGDQASAFGDSAVASGTNSVALGNGSVADRANSVSVGSQGHERVITNVADATAPTDAVNMRMMQAGDAATLKAANDYTDSQIDDVWQNLSSDIDHVNRQANRGIAAASALINVTPYLPGHTAVNAGVATYRGEVALGIGVSRWSENGRVNFNAGVSAAKGDDAVVRVGVGYVF